MCIEKTLMINKKTFPWWIYIFFSTLCPHVLLGQIALLVFIVFSFAHSIKKRAYVNWIPFLLLEAVFLIYSVIQCLGIAADSSVALQMCKTVAINLIFDVAFLNYSINIKSEHLVETYINGCFWGFIVCLILYGYTIGNSAIYDGRLTSAISIGYGIFKISGHSPTALAAIASNAMIMSMLIYWRKNKKYALMYFSFFSFIILLTKSRKNLVFILFSILIIPFCYSGKGFNTKKLKIMFSGIILCVLGCFAIIKIPYFYEHIGMRLLSILDGVLQIGISESSFGESSIRTRESLIVLAKAAFIQKPVYGWGLNNFSEVINKGGYYTHNGFWEMLVSGGIIGFTIYYAKYFCILKKMYNGIKKKSLQILVPYKIGLLAFILYCFLEYWQITYMFRFIYIFPILLLKYAQINETESYKGDMISDD